MQVLRYFCFEGSSRSRFFPPLRRCTTKTTTVDAELLLGEKKEQLGDLCKVYLGLAMEGFGLGYLEWVASSGLGLALVLFLWIGHYSRAQQIRRGKSGRVPPGRFWQLPYLGESFQFLMSPTVDDFVLPRVTKYGKDFRTNLQGHPTICTTSAEATRFVFQSPKFFEADYPRPFKDIFGRNSILFLQGEVHSRYRRLIQGRFTPESLKKFTPHIDKVATQWLRTRWGDQATVTAMHEIEQFIFQVILLFICDSLTPSADTMRLCKLFEELRKGFMCLPNSFPWSEYSKALTARKQIVQFLNKVIQERRQEQGKVQHDDMLQCLLDSEAHGIKLNHDQMTDNIVTLLIAGRDTSYVTLTWFFHSLLMYPQVLEQVQAENDTLARERKHVDDPLTWDDSRKLHYTSQVIHETLRTVSVVPFVFRETKQDVIFNGLLFPKGWKVLAWTKYFHVDPEHYADPLKFDPSRFETPPKSNTFAPFGTGPRACPGNELAKLQMLVFVHRVLTTYDFKSSGVLDLSIIDKPVPTPRSGLPITVTKRSAPGSGRPVHHVQAPSSCSSCY